MIIPFKGKNPKVEKGVFVAPNATIIGDVTIAKDCGIWFGAVIRGDSNSIKIGSRTNIQDNSVLHIETTHSLTIGDDVTVGHRSVLHGCKIGNRVIVGMGAVIMNGAEIGDDSIVGAGALVTEDSIFPPKSLVLGFPAKLKSELSEEHLKMIRRSALHYVEFASVYRDDL